MESVAYKAARSVARGIDSRLKATDERFERVVRVLGEDGSVFLYDSAFALRLDSDWIGVFTEHYGFHVFHEDDHPLQQADGWKGDATRTPCAGLVQIGVHDLDNLACLFGPARRVQAWTGGQLPDRIRNDACAARLEYDNGVCATLLCAYTVGRCRSITVMGTAGTVVSPNETTITYVPTPLSSRQEETIALEQNDAIREEFAEFARCCLEGLAPETDGLVGAAAVAAMNAIIRSASSNGGIEEVDTDFPSSSRESAVALP